MTSAPPQYSPDGQWWWNGTQWVPAAQAPQPAQPSYPGYGGYGGYPAPPPPAQNDGKAIASLVLGIVWVVGLTSIAAVVLGHLSRRDARKQGRQPSGLALAGLILGYLGIAGAVAFGALIAVGASVAEEADSRFAVRSDLRQLAVAEEAYNLDNSTYTADLSTLSSYGWDTDNDSVVVVTATEVFYCLAGTADNGDTYYLSSRDPQVTRTPCT